MNNKIVKYEGNVFNRIISKIKLLFCKGKVEEVRVEEARVEKEINNEEAKKKFVELVRKFNAREIEEKDLTEEEIDQLTKYYENRNKELDEQIESQKRTLEELNAKLNRYYNKVMKLKAE